MTILVTGGAGFIGSNFVLDWLEHSDETVVNLDKLTYAGNLGNLASLEGNPRHVFVKGDIGDLPLLERLLAEHREHLGLYYRLWSFAHLCEPQPSLSPIFSFNQGKLSCRYLRQYIELGHEICGLPLSTVEKEALDLFDALANDPELHFGMQLQPGDMQFVYNHAQLHDRTAFVDWPEPDKKRHLLRLWLSVAGDRPLPECFKQRYGSIEIGRRGGIVTKETRLHAPLD